MAKGQQEKALDEAVFAAEKGELEGPVKTQFGWYVFEVTKITPASQQSLEEAKETIKNLLRSQRQQKALDDFIKDFREDYKDDTNCADDYVVAECKQRPRRDHGHRRRRPAARRRARRRRPQHAAAPPRRTPHAAARSAQPVGGAADG